MHHPLLVAIKSKTRGATQADLCKFLQDLKTFATRYSNNGSALLLPETKLFSDDAVVRREHDKWAAHGSTQAMIDKLFEPAPELRDITITCLEAEMLAVIGQLDSNSSSYLAGGKIAKLFDPNEPQTPETIVRREHMLTCDLSADDMERLYGLLSYDMDLTKTLKLKTVSGMSAWRYNNIRDWLLRLPPCMSDMIFSMARFLARHTHAERENNLEAAHAGKMQMMIDKEATNKIKRKNLLKSLIY